MSLLPKLMEFGSLLANAPESDSSLDGIMPEMRR